MTLPALATIDDLSDRLIDELSDADLARAQAALNDASTVIRAEIGLSLVDDEGALALPAEGWKADTLVSVTCAVALRALQNPQNYADEPQTHTADIYLKGRERRAVRRAADVNATSVPLQGDTTTLGAIGFEGYP